MQTRWILGLAVGTVIILSLVLWWTLPCTSTPPGILQPTGRIEGDQAAVGAKVGGKIIRLPISEGEQLKAGGLIAELASEQVQAQLEQAEHTLHTAREQVAMAEAHVVSTQRQIDAAQTAEASVRLAQANLHDTRVLAPFAGTVLRKLVERGEVLAAGTPLVTMVDLSRLHAKVYVAEADLGKVKVGDPARIYTDAFPRRYFEANVVQIAQQAEFTPRDMHMQDERVKLVFAVKLGVHNPEGILKPGMPVDTRIRWEPQALWRDGME